MRRKEKIIKLSIAIGLTAVLFAVVMCAPACAYDESITEDYFYDPHHTQDNYTDRFLIKYDENKKPDNDIFSISWNPEYDVNGTEPLGWVTLNIAKNNKYYSVKTEILNDLRTEEPGLLVLKKPDECEDIYDALTAFSGEITVWDEEEQKYKSVSDGTGIIYSSECPMPINPNDDRYAPAILDAYRSDRIYSGSQKITEKLAKLGFYLNETNPFWLQIPSNMTFEEALEYCYAELGGGEYSSVVPNYTIYDRAKKGLYLSYSHPNRIEVMYISENGAKMQWDEVTHIQKYRYGYSIPKNMTMAEAVAECMKNTNVKYVKPGSIPLWIVQYSDSTYSDSISSNNNTAYVEDTNTPVPQSPVPMFGAICSILCLSLLSLRKKH